MAHDSQRTTGKQKLSKVVKESKMIEENSAQELTFSYAYDCLNESARTENQFLGFTLSSDYVPVHHSRSEELSKLRYYFEWEVLQAVLVFRVNEQQEPVIKWTDREAMQTYLKQNGGV